MIKLSITLNDKTLEREFVDEKELIAAADKLKESRKKGELSFKDRLHKEFYNMIQDNADGYRRNVSKKLINEDEGEETDAKSNDDLGFVKKAKVSAPAAEPAHTSDAEKSACSKKEDVAAAKSLKARAERKYKEALAAAQAETDEYQKTVARLSKELKEAETKHMDAKSKLEEAKREYLRAAFYADEDRAYEYSYFYDLLDSLFGRINRD